MADAKNKNSAKTTEQIYIPKEYHNDDSLYVSINGRRWLIKKGQVVNVPHHVAALIRDSMRQKDEAQRYIESHER